MNLVKAEKQALSVIEGAKIAAQITDEVSYQLCLEYLCDVKRAMKTWADIHEDSRLKAKASYDAVLAVINRVKKPGEEAIKKILEPALNGWEQKMELKRQEDQARLAKIAVDNDIDVPTILPPATPDHDDTQKRVKCDVVVEDLAALVKAVAAGKAPIEFLTPNTTELCNAARELGDRFNVPGCRVTKRNIHALVGKR